MLLSKTETINKHVFATGINLQECLFESITLGTTLTSNRYDRFLKNCKDNEFIVEIKKPENLHILEIVHSALSNIVSYLNERYDSKYNLHLYLSKDVEIPDWRQFTIKITSHLSDYDQREELWDRLIEIFDESYKQYLLRVKKLVETEHEKEAYRKISLIVE